ncbi:hypothetical protein N8878_07035 [Psychromonas sp.]|nr:hypothetical protein [Psychromonas sp.]
MNQKIKLNKLLIAFSILLSTGCNASTTEIAPYFNKENQSTAFFDNALILTSASDFSSALDKRWDYPVELKHETQNNSSVSSCQQLKQSIKNGFTAAKNYEYSFVKAQSAICSTWEQQSHFAPSRVSYLNTLKLDESFANQAPTALALTISDEQKVKAKTASSWNDFSKIIKVISNSDTQSTYYDQTGGIQRLSLMAKGDYNGDGIEDCLLFMENSVEGGSYSSTEVYIITRMSVDGPLTLINKVRDI